MKTTKTFELIKLMHAEDPGGWYTAREIDDIFGDGNGRLIRAAAAKRSRNYKITVDRKIQPFAYRIDYVSDTPDYRVGRKSNEIKPVKGWRWMMENKNREEALKDCYLLLGAGNTPDALCLSISFAKQMAATCPEIAGMIDELEKELK